MTRNKLPTHTLIFLILILGVLFRIIGFSHLPLSLNRDEVSLGYNAFSIATEGIDEWGVSFPLMFKAFGDYKLPGYIYTLVPFIKVFGNTDLAVRLPSLLAGIFNIFLIFLISKSISKIPSKLQLLIPAFFIAISPWAIHYSSMAFEAHLSLTFTLVSILLLISSATKPVYMYLATLFYFVAQNTYNTPLLLSLPILISFLWIYRKKVSIKNPHIVVSILLWVIGFILTSYIQFAAFSHKGNTAIFFHPDYISAYWEANSQANQKGFPISLFVNKFTFFGLEIGKNYLSSFSPDFLVFSGGSHPWHSIPNRGHFALAQYTLIIIGLYGLIIKINKSSWEKWLLLLIAISPIPSAITNDAPHTTRSLILLSLLAFTVPYAFQQIKRVFKSKYMTIFIILFILLESLIYKYDYLYKFPNNHTFAWKVGLKEAVVEVHQNYSDTHDIYVTDFDWSPYIYTLFYNQISPSRFVRGVEYHLPDNIGYIHIKSFENYHYWAEPEDLPETSVLLDQVDNEFIITVRD